MKLYIYYGEDFETEKHPSTVQYDDLPDNVKLAVDAVGKATVVAGNIEHTVVTKPVKK